MLIHDPGIHSHVVVSYWAAASWTIIDMNASSVLRGGRSEGLARNMNGVGRDSTVNLG